MGISEAITKSLIVTNEKTPEQTIASNIAVEAFDNTGSESFLTNTFAEEEEPPRSITNLERNFYVANAKAKNQATLLKVRKKEI